jgi:hypothetical protein
MKITFIRYAQNRKIVKPNELVCTMRFMNDPDEVNVGHQYIIYVYKHIYQSIIATLLCGIYIAYS